MAWICDFSEAVPKAKGGDPDAIRRVVLQALDILAPAIAARVAPGIEADDLRQVAALAVFRAIRTFRPDAGRPFVGYAMDGAAFAMDREAGTAGVVRPKRKAYRAYKAYRKLAAAHPGASVPELAALLGVPEREVVALHEIGGMWSQVDLDAPLGHGDDAGEDDPATRGQGLADPDALDRMERDAEAADARRVAAHLFAALDPRELIVVRDAFAGDDWTLQRKAATAAKVGTTARSVEAVLERGLRKLRGYQIPARGRRSAQGARQGLR